MLYKNKNPDTNAQCSSKLLMLKMFSKFISSCFLFLHLLLTGSQACSYSCDPDQRACLDNVWGSVAADCSGFVGCVNITQPCAWECPPDYPVMSEDGLDCFPCPEYSSWCEKEGRCFDPESEPCNAECHTMGLHYCQDKNTCMEEGVTCGGEVEVQRLPASNDLTKDLALPYTGPLQPQYFFLVPSFVLVNPFPQLDGAAGVPMHNNAAVLQAGGGQARNSENDKKTPNYPGLMGFGWFQIPFWNLGTPIVEGPVDIEV